MRFAHVTELVLTRDQRVELQPATEVEVHQARKIVDAERLDPERQVQEALSPLEEGTRQLHAAVYEAASAIRASLQKHQALRGPSARKVRDLCRWYAMMNWQGDAQSEALVRELEQLATAPASRNRKRDPEPIEQVLGDIIALTYADASALAEPNRMAALEL